MTERNSVTLAAGYSDAYRLFFLALAYPFRIPFFFFNDPPPAEIYTLSLHDALPISFLVVLLGADLWPLVARGLAGWRSEEHTSELQSRFDLVCRLLLEKKKNMKDVFRAVDSP